MIIMSDAPQKGGEVPHPKGDVPHPPRTLPQCLPQ